MQVTGLILLQSQKSIEKGVAKRESSNQYCSWQQQQRKELSDDRRRCQYQYYHKSGRYSDGNSEKGTHRWSGRIHPQHDHWAWAAGTGWGDPGAGRSDRPECASRLAECGDGDALDGEQPGGCLLYTSDAADDLLCVDLG